MAPTTNIGSTDAATLKHWLGDGRELAILDAREDGEFGRDHIFWANPCPLSKMEWRARALLPSRGVRVVCVDGGGDHARRLAGFLVSIGCTDVSVLAGGMPAWIAAGGIAFSNFNVPSKAFGEWVEHHYETPSVDAAELHAMIGARADIVILDSRPMEEFSRMSIPGGVDVPGGELVYRIGEFVTRPETLVVVNCAGRTRSILGAESLRSAGIPNPVVALRNGTMGWELAGFTCERGKTDTFPGGTPRGMEAAFARADDFARRHGVRVIDRAGLAAMQAEATRTTYLLDVRSPAEYAAGHLPGSASAPGGQVVQATDQWIAVRHARIVLVDDTGVRARMAGGWLRQLGGWEVYVLEGGLAGTLEPGVPPLDCPEAASISVPHLQPADLAALVSAGAVQVVDLRRSVDYRKGHIPGALWGIRTRLGALPLRADRPIIVAASEPAQARLGAAEIQALTGAQVSILEGGTRAWRAAGFPVEASPGRPSDAECIDLYLLPYDRHEGVEQAKRDYITWEIDLVNDVARDGSAPFGAWPAR